MLASGAKEKKEKSFLPCRAATLHGAKKLAAEDFLAARAGFCCIGKNHIQSSRNSGIQQKYISELQPMFQSCLYLFGLYKEWKESFLKL